MVYGWIWWYLFGLMFVCVVVVSLLAFVVCAVLFFWVFLVFAFYVFFNDGMVIL